MPEGSDGANDVTGATLHIMEASGNVGIAGNYAHMTANHAGNNNCTEIATFGRAGLPRCAN